MVEEKKFQSYKVTAYVHEILGDCPMVFLGDKLVFDSMLYLDESKISGEKLFEKRLVICPWIIVGLFPFILAMNNGVSAVDLGISKGGEDGYAQCAAWGPPECVHGVVFRLHPEPIEKGFIDRFYEYEAKTGWLAIPDYYHKYATPAQKEAWKKDWRKVAETLKLKV